LNLVVNALEAVPAGAGEVHIAITRDDRRIELCVCDNGRGMTPQTRDQVFEPFFTEKRSDRPGTGLGLSVVYSIVQDHDGQVEAQSDGLGMGSRFIVRLPIAQEVCRASAD
jgi:two-component system NtrC family sensor kinase